MVRMNQLLQIDLRQQVASVIATVLFSATADIVVVDIKKEGLTKSYFGLLVPHALPFF